MAMSLPDSPPLEFPVNEMTSMTLTPLPTFSIFTHGRSSVAHICSIRVNQERDDTYPHFKAGLSWFDNLKAGLAEMPVKMQDLASNLREVESNPLDFTPETAVFSPKKN
jgi:hypothetical protein